MESSHGCCCGCRLQYIRLNVLTDATVTDQGPIVGKAHLLARYRKSIDAENVMIFADIYCKHGAPMTPRSLHTVAREMIGRGMADALIVDGADSSQPAPMEKIQAVRNAVPETLFSWQRNDSQYY